MTEFMHSWLSEYYSSDLLYDFLLIYYTIEFDLIVNLIKSQNLLFGLHLDYFLKPN